MPLQNGIREPRELKGNQRQANGARTTTVYENSLYNSNRKNSIIQYLKAKADISAARAFRGKEPILEKRDFSDIFDDAVSLTINEPDASDPEYGQKKEIVVTLNDFDTNEFIEALSNEGKTPDEQATIAECARLALNELSEIFKTQGEVITSSVKEIFELIPFLGNAAKEIKRIHDAAPEIFDLFYKGENEAQALEFIDSLADAEYKIMDISTDDANSIRNAPKEKRIIEFLERFDFFSDELPEFYKAVMAGRGCSIENNTSIVIKTNTSINLNVPKGFLCKQAFDRLGTLISNDREYRKVKTGGKNDYYYALAYINFDDALKKGLIEPDIKNNPLYGYAERVHAAVFSLCKEGNFYQSVDMIYNKMYLTDDLRCPEKQAQMINDCMELMKSTDTSIISENQIKYSQKNGQKPRPLEGSLIPWERISNVVLNGNETTVYHIFRCPPLAQYEYEAGRILTIEKADLNIPKVKIIKSKDKLTGKTIRKAAATRTKDIAVVRLLENTVENGEIKYYVLAYIDMLRRKANFNNLLKYDTLYESMQIEWQCKSESATANKKRKISDRVLMILQNQVRLKKIFGYEEISKGKVQRYGVQIFLSKSKKGKAR